MSNFSVGQKFKNKLTGSNYEIYDIVGKAKSIASETDILFLKLTSKSGFLGNPNNAQLFTITAREILNFFDPVIETR